jgi:hypothetical protein
MAYQQSKELKIGVPCCTITHWENQCNLQRGQSIMSLSSKQVPCQCFLKLWNSETSRFIHPFAKAGAVSWLIIIE